MVQGAQPVQVDAGLEITKPEGDRFTQCVFGFKDFVVVGGAPRVRQPSRQPRGRVSAVRAAVVVDEEGMRAGSEPEVVAAAPVQAVVFRCVARPCMGRHFVLQKAVGGRDVGDALVGEGLAIVVDGGAGATFDQLHQRRAGLDGQQVGAHVNDAELGSSGEVGLESRVAFARHANDEIDADVEAGSDKGSDGLGCFCAVVRTAEPSQHHVVKALHADAHAREARGAETNRERCVDVFGIHLK